MNAVQNVDELIEGVKRGDSVAIVCVKTMLYQYLDLIEGMEQAIETRNIYGGKVENLPKELKHILGESIE